MTGSHVRRESFAPMTPFHNNAFQVKPQTLFLEEDVTMNAEFPEEGKFHLQSLW